VNAYSSPAEESNQPVIVFYGDSRAAAWPVPEQIRNVTVINHGIGYQTTAKVLGRFRQHVAPLKPKVIVIQVGTNDLRTIPLFPDQKEMIIGNCKANIKQIVNLSLETGARVVLTTIFPPGTLPIVNRPFASDDLAAAIKDVNAYIETLESNRVTVFDTSRVLANSQGTVNPKYSRDFLHLNKEGYAVLNQAMADILRPQ